MPDGTIAFVEVDEYGRSGVSIQDFTPGRDSATSRRRLAGFAPDTETECFAISPDGQRIALVVKDVSRHLMMIDGIPGGGR